MQLVRHIPVGITLMHYQSFTLLDLWAEIGKLPPIAAPRETGNKVTGS
ncbi:MAG: hypothetical protein WBE26_07850 [Phycisphaerae bacterium]